MEQGNNYESAVTPDRNLQKEAEDGSNLLVEGVTALVTKLFHSLARKYRIPYTYVGVATTTAVVDAMVGVNVNREGVARTFKNKSGESISIGDKLYVLAVDGSLSNAFVFIKY